MRKETVRNMGRRWLGAAMLTLAGACAHNLPIDGNPDRVWASSLSLARASACIVKALDGYRRTQSSLAPSITHASRAIEPGKVHEIRPRQDFTVAAENYYVRLEKIDDRITRISLFADSPWRKQLTRAISPCGARS